MVKLCLCLSLIIVIAGVKPATALVTAEREVFRWIRREKIKAAYFYSSQDERHIRDLKEAGFNCALVKLGLSPENPGADEEGLKVIEKFSRWIRKYGLHFFPVLNYAGSPEVALLKKYARKYTTSSGRILSNTPCPLNERYWEKVILERFTVLGKVAKKENITGLLFDPEMYGADISGYSGEGCFCGKCFEGFLRAEGIKMKATEISPEKRSEWLKNSNLMEKYLGWQERELERIVSGIRERLEWENKNLIFGFLNYWDIWFYRGLVKGLGTGEKPVTIWSETTYGTGYTSYVKGQIEEFAKRGNWVIFVPGLWISKFMPDYIDAQCYHLAINSDGYWLFTTYSLWEKPEKLSGDYWVPGKAEDYWEAFKRANEELSKKVRDLKYESSLVIRPSPPIIKPVEVREFRQENLVPLFTEKIEGSKKIAPTRLRGQSLILTYLRENEELKFEVANIQLGHYNDGTGWILLDCEGNKIGEGQLGLNEKNIFTAKGAKEGVYTLIIASGSNTHSVNIYDHWEVYRADPLRLACYAAPLYFYVPKNTKEFTVSVTTTSTDETVKLQVVSSKNEVVIEESGGYVQWMDFKIKVSEGEDGQVWRLRLTKAEFGVFEDVEVKLSKNIPPYFSEEPKRLLVPKSSP